MSGVSFAVGVVAIDPVPAGGTTGQILAKKTDGDYDTEWVTGGGGGGAVDSVNGQTGTVVLTYSDVGAASAAQGSKADTAVQPNTTPSLTQVTLSTDPTTNLQAATKQYVDTVAVQSVHYHTAIKYELAVTDATVTYNNGSSGVGATLTNAGTLSVFTPDGVVASVGDRILVYRQNTNPQQNGVYTVTTVGSGSVAWVLTRATDANSYDPISPNGLGGGDAFFITSGNTGSGETYVCSNVGSITFGTTPITFSQISDTQIYSAGTGLTLTGTQFSITNTGTAGTYGSSVLIPVITTNAQGQVTGVTTASNPQGTVTSVAALTLGTTGTDLSSTVATGTTTPVITLNVPTASASNRGVLSSTDWSTFNGKQAALISGTNIKTINGASVLGSGDLTVSGSFTGGTLTNELILDAGSTTAPPLSFQSGTLTTSPVAGDVEFDGDVFYGTVGTNNRGVIPAEYFVVLQSNNTLTSQTAAQPIFDGGGTGLTNGALSLGTGTFFFECMFHLGSLSTTSSSFGFALGGTATKTQYWEATAKKSTLSTAGTAQNTFNTAANTAIASATTTATGYAMISGTIDITVAGTIIPQVSLGVAAAAVVNAGSYFRIRRMGSNTVAYMGNWS